MNSDQGNSYSFKKSRGCCTVKKILIFIVLEVIVILIAAGVIFYLKYGNESCVKKSSRRPKIDSPLTYSKLFSWSYEARGFNGSWISDNEIFMKNSLGEYVLYDFIKKTQVKVVTNKTLINKADRVEMSADKKYLLFTYGVKKEFRWSSNFSATIYNIETQTKVVLSGGTVLQCSQPIRTSYNSIKVEKTKKTLIAPKLPAECQVTPIYSRNQEELQNTDGEPLTLQSFKWDPVGNGYSYVHENNVYYTIHAFSDDGSQITTNGSPTLFNGICDWVYEEEIFRDSSALWYSPDGKKLAFASFNDNSTDEMSITYYGEGRNMKYQYPALHTIRYPKAGRTNPTAQLHVACLDGNEALCQHTIELGTIFPQQILISVTWINNIKLAFVLMNRVQNKAAVLIYDVPEKRRELILSLENDKGWIEMFESPLFTNNGELMLYIYSWDQGNNMGGYRHLTIYNTTKRTASPLTQGKFTVTQILAWDKLNNIVYFLATEEDRPMNLQIYKVKVNESAPQKAECLSCANDDACHYWAVQFSHSQSYRSQTCLGPSVPYVKVFDKNNNEILAWEENKLLQENLKNIILPTKHFLKIPINSDTEVNVQLQIPSTIDQSGERKYPLLVYVYGGPNFNLVTDRFKVNWDVYFSLNYNTILATIDGRGSGLNGDKFLLEIYRNLGGVEVYDQLNVTRQLQEKYPFIDKTRTGIWGWSYGGYVTGMSLAKDSENVFKCGMSIAPVTDWIYYDSIYTERYMGLPTENDNLAGYNSSSLLNIAKQLKSKKYSLVHGSYDDNVHVQHSMMLARILQKNDVEFSQSIYPNEQHGLTGVKDHLYHNLESFFSECFA